MAGSEPIYTMGAMLRAAAAKQPDADALIFPDRRLSYRELNDSARAWAKAFIGMGIQPGQNIGILLTTRPDFVEIFYGIVMAGAVAVPVNARYQALELNFLIRDADLVLLASTGRVADNLDFGERLVAALPSLQHARDPMALGLEEAPMLRGIVCLERPCPSYLLGRDQVLALGRDIPESAVDARIDAVDDEDIAMILYTSGTTANPKGALISHRAQVATAAISESAIR